MRALSFRLILLIIMAILTSTTFALTSQKSIMKNYCSVPPYMELPVDPNIILIMDYSGSMQLPAHFGCSWDSYKKVAECNGGSWISRTYNKNKTYYGYFKPGAYYKYNSSGKYWEENTTCNPSGSQKRIGTGPNCVSGNLLNWISMSRYDTALKALTGGKIRECKSTSDSNKCLIPKGAHRKVKEYSNLNCKFEVYPNYHWDNTSQFNNPNYDLKITVKNRSNSKKCKIGTFSGRWLRVKVDNPSNVKGILQQNADLGNYAFMIFSYSGYSSYNRQGEIAFGLDEYRSYATKSEAMDNLVTLINESLPWGGTPTGEALYEAMDYIKQQNQHYYEYNSSYISRGTPKDPFYNPAFNGLSPCIKNSILLISDGEWNGSQDPLYAAYILHTRDLRTDLPGTQNANIYTIFTFANSNAGKNSMKSVAAAGSFTDIDGNNYPFNIDVTDNSKYVSWPRSDCDPSSSSSYNDNLCKEWDTDKDGVPNTYFFASDGQALEHALNEALNSIVKYNYSGGSLGVMAERNKDNSSLALSYRGSILVQSMFYSQKDGVDWIGKLYGYWFHFDTNTIREDTIADRILKIDKDKVISFKLENNKKLKIERYNVNTDGTTGSLDTILYDPDNTKHVLEPGEDLLYRNYNDRTIYFAACKSGPSCMDDFVYTNLNQFKYEISDSGTWKIPLLGLPGECFNMCNYWGRFSSFNPLKMWNQFWDCINDHNDYEKIVNYIRGRDYTGFRTRAISGNTWKLGDIMYSAPQIVRYESNGKSYMFVGANDGMLHVFEIGKLSKNGLSDEKEIVKLEGNNIGKEIWAFIPFNLLPYLRFLTDPDYCHMYYADLSPHIYKLKDGRIILIGGLRLGAATGSTNTVSNSSHGNNPVNPPGWACPANFFDFLKEQCQTCADLFGIGRTLCNFLPSSLPDYSNCVGLSSYFALDITDPENPVFLWEFSHPALGFSYSGATIIYKSTETYVMFGSGPTSYDGNSTQSLKFFVIPLDNPDVNNPYILEPKKGSRSIKNAFSGRLSKYGYDYKDAGGNRDGITDYVFVGYARRDGDMKNWKGGILKIDVRDEDPSYWTFQPYFIDAQSPVTAQIEIGECFNNDYMFFGTGRWFYKLDNSLPGQKNRIYGVPISCDDSGNCSPNTNVAHSSKDVCTDAGNNVIRSWYIELDAGNSSYLKERNITDPVLTDQNIVLFTTTEPANNACSFGGRTRIWALNCATGGTITESCGSYPIDIDKVKGVVLLQLSGGDIKQIDVKNINKNTPWFTGTAPESAPPFIGSAKSITKVGELLLWIEK